MKELVTYLNFDGKCGEAMKFYAKCLAAELQMMPFAEIPGGAPEAAKDRIMHARLAKGSAVLMASDTQPGDLLTQGNNFYVAIMCESQEELDRLFNAIGEKGKVILPPQDMFWGARFGMLTDRFGINWMFNYDLPKQ